MKKIEYEDINGLLYSKLTLSPQKEIHLTRVDTVFKIVLSNRLYKSINKWQIKWISTNDR